MTSLSPRQRDLAVWGIVIAAGALAVPGLYRLAGPPMEEGYMLVFPERVLAGDRPHVDFLHLYGPGALWFLAAVYRVFGAALAVERTVGLVQHVAIIAAVVTVTRRWGRPTAVVSGLIAVLLTLTASGLVALAWSGGVAMVLWGTIIALDETDRYEPRPWAYAASGVLFGVALLYRPDLIVAVVAALAVVAVKLRRRPRERSAVATGLVIGVTPILVLLGQVGVGHAVNGIVLDPVLRLRAGRRLNVPPSWNELDGALQKGGAFRAWRPIPTIAESRQVFIWFVALIVIAVGVAIIAVRAVRAAESANATSARAWMLLGVAAVGVGLLPQALQRPDTTHLAWVGCVPLSMAPAALAHWSAHRADRAADWRKWAALLAMPALLVVLVPTFTVVTYADIVGQTFGARPGGVAVTRRDRQFRLGSNEQARTAQAVVDRLDELATPGQRLFVGTADLSRTPYDDAYFYHLFPELTPATYHIDMNPGLANAPHGGLDTDVASADWLILARWWEVWDEPNDSMVPGPDAANQVVATQFCEVASYDDALLLYRRCDR